MSIFSSARTIYYGTMILDKLGIDVGEMKGKLAEKIKDYASDCVGNISQETLDKRIENIEVPENLTEEEIQARQETVDAYIDMLEAAGGEENKYENLIENAEAHPEEYGEMFKNVDASTFENMAEHAEAGESVTWDIVKVAYGTSTGAIDNFNEKYADGPSEDAPAPSDEPQMDSTDAPVTDRGATVDTELDLNIPSSTEPDMSLEQ